MTVTALVLIEAEPHAISRLGQQLTTIDGVAEAHSVAGGDTDLVAIIRVADHEAVADVVTESISKIDGIRSTSTMIAFRTYSAEVLDAAYEGFGD